MAFNEAGAGVLPHATSALSFGLEAVGGSRTLSLPLSNAGTGVLIAQNSTAISGVNANEFHLLAICSSTPIPSGQSCNLQVSFAPQFAGAKSAVLDIAFNGGAPPLHAQLTGTGIVANDRLVGRVTDRQTGQPLSHITVNAYDASGTPVTAAITDIDGTYATVSLPAGGYYAKAIGSPDRVDLLYRDISCALGCNVTTGTGISLPAGIATTNIDFSLYKPASIVGTITADNAAALVGVTVRLYNPDGNQVKDAVTDGSGHYQFQNLAPGSYLAGTLNTAGYTDKVFDNISCVLGCDIKTLASVTAPVHATAIPAGTASPGIANFVLSQNTPAGANVVAAPRLADFSLPVTATFVNVTAAGHTTMLASSSGAALPVGFSAGSPARFYDVQTTASFTTGATVCVNYSGTAFFNLSGVRLLYWRNGSWSDVTSSLNQATRTVCGVVESMGSFTVAETNSTTLATQSCALEPAFRSIDGTTPVTVQFTNNLAATINVYWLDYNGQRVIYATLPPGGSYVQSTFLTHPWLITDQSSQCRGIYLPLPFSAQAVIQ